jgi:hypothetical protein
MAGDWIPLRCDLPDDPAVIFIAVSLALDEFAVVGRLHRLWSWANKHTSTGNAVGVTSEWVDRYLSTPGFAAAMQTAGWLRVRTGGIEFPHFDRWNSQNAKQRALTARRVAAHKLRSNAVGNADSVSDALPTEQNRRDKDPPTPPAGGKRAKKRPGEEHPHFAAFWAAYPRKTARPKAAESFARVAPDDATLAAMLAALDRQRRSAEWTKDAGRFIPHPATWLNQRRWEDQPPEVSKPESTRVWDEI